jgi:hypothetical protein
MAVRPGKGQFSLGWLMAKPINLGADSRANMATTGISKLNLL